MLARLPSLKLVRLWAMLLLAVIGLEAMLPMPPSLEQQSGAAFSASTKEVALYVQRNERGQRQAVAPVPLPWLVSFTPFAFDMAPMLADLFTLRPDSTGPPLRDIHSWDPAPRAPPRA